ncbi:hypothetical protein [Myoviridae environmental samples]|nr:hypothetical protein [Myoviridae environmental samples]
MKQYASSPVIQKIVADRASYFPSGWIGEFYDNYWNLDTAKGNGLDIWGRIVVVGRDVQIEYTPTTFGFNEAWSTSSGGGVIVAPLVINSLSMVLFSKYNPSGSDDRVQPFDQAPFYDGEPATQTATLADEAYRKLIIAKALSNISDCTTKSLNKIINLIFGGPGRRCYVQTTNRMDISYVFEFELSPVEKTIAVQSGIIPRPAGVRLSVVQVNPDETFGFAEGKFQPFDQGSFLGDQGVISEI